MERSQNDHPAQEKPDVHTPNHSTDLSSGLGIESRQWARTVEDNRSRFRVAHWQKRVCRD